MYAAHFAAGLALKSCVPRAPTWALLTGAFLPDFFWVGLARAGVEPTQPFFDDWSHSLMSVLLLATGFALFFLPYGRAAVIAIWTAVFSHFLLDLPIHPAYLAIYPHSSVHIGMAISTKLGFRPYWWIQFGVVIVLAAIYVYRARTLRYPMHLILASCVTLLGLHLLMFPA